MRNSCYIPINIKKRVLQFHKQCFLEARSAYLNAPPEAAKVEAILKRFGGEEDLNWMGSKVLQTYYYDQLKAREPIPGFLFTKHPNSNFEEASKKDSNIKTHIPTHGYPTCNQWWHKIKKNLVKVSEKAGVFDKHIGTLDITNRIYAYKAKHKLAWNSDLTPEDYIAKMLLHDNRYLQIKSTQSLMDNTNNMVGTLVTRGLINAGQNIKSWTTTPLKREAIIQTLPVIHAFFYFFLIILTPLVLALSGYSSRSLGSICALFMMAIFIQFIWHLVGYIERAVLDPMGENNAVAAMRNMAVLFYIIAPMLLLKLSGHFGGDAGAGLSELLGTADKTANDSVATSNTVAKTGMRIASKGAFR
ncbi:MAG: conjugal transfer protein TraG N-terminal domain-containing protein [Gammaproteobacteria bacterium]